MGRQPHAPMTLQLMLWTGAKVFKDDDAMQQQHIPEQTDSVGKGILDQRKTGKTSQRSEKLGIKGEETLWEPGSVLGVTNMETQSNEAEQRLGNSGKIPLHRKGACRHFEEVHILRDSYPRTTRTEAHSVSQRLKLRTKTDWNVPTACRSRNW